MEEVCTLEFDVSVRTDDRFVKLITVQIIVDDTNDNPPSFNVGRDITLNVPESSPLLTEFPISGAIDQDAGLKANIRSESSHFCFPLFVNLSTLID